MKIVDESTLDLFRTPGKCEVCQTECRIRAPHHIWAKGIGGGGRLDVPINLIAVGGMWNGWPECHCHRTIHDGNLSKDWILDIVARREKMTPQEIKDEIARLLRLDKDGKEPRRPIK